MAEIRDKQDFVIAEHWLVSNIAVISVVTQRINPLAAVDGPQACMTTLMTSAQEAKKLNDSLRKFNWWDLKSPRLSQMFDGFKFQIHILWGY